MLFQVPQFKKKCITFISSFCTNRTGQIVEVVFGHNCLLSYVSVEQAYLYRDKLLRGSNSGPNKTALSQGFVVVQNLVRGTLRYERNLVENIRKNYLIIVSMLPFVFHQNNFPNYYYYQVCFDYVSCLIDEHNTQSNFATQIVDLFLNRLCRSWTIPCIVHKL